MTEVVARVFGQAVLEAPKDLFIPPDALQVMLQQFEGPLDLLLYLIRKQNIDILDIPVATVTEQYLDYINAMAQGGIDIACEYLLMAGMLVEIKARLLLPRTTTDEDEEIDPRAELAQRLIAYEQIKQASQILNDRPQAMRDFFPVCLSMEPIINIRLPEIQIRDLQLAYLTVCQRNAYEAHHTIEAETLSVRERMSDILQLLKQQKNYTLPALFQEPVNIPLLVTTFLALLELEKSGLIYIIQDNAFAQIEIQSK